LREKALASLINNILDSNKLVLQNFSRHFTLSGFKYGQHVFLTHLE
jgi:hypothetical protein